MTVAPRARTRRAVNLDAPEGPIIPPSEVHARNAYKANKAKNAAASDEKTHSKEAHRLFVAENRQRFTFMEGNKEVEVLIEAQKPKDEVSTEKLYALVTGGEITLEQFVSVVGATQGDVKKVLGTNVLMKVLNSTPQEPKFVIREVKEGK